MRLFEISEIETARVNCNCSALKTLKVLYFMFNWILWREKEKKKQTNKKQQQQIRKKKNQKKKKKNRRNENHRLVNLIWPCANFGFTRGGRKIFGLFMLLIFHVQLLTHIMREGKVHIIFNYGTFGHILLAKINLFDSNLSL